MTRPLELFWWSPRRDAKLGTRELRNSYKSWLRIRQDGGTTLTNFGDELSPLVLQYATGRRVKWSPPNKAEIISIGSILEYVNKRTEHQPWIWGTGLRTAPNPSALPALTRNADRVLAVRGPLSRQALGLPGSLAIGDPGVLAPELARFNAPRRKGTLFIPHFRTWGSKTGRGYLEQARMLGYEVANPSSHPLEMISQIVRSDFVLSSSLHGVIVSHALGVPVQLVSIPTSGHRHEPEFKYQDYFNSIGVSFSSVDLMAALTPSNREALLGHRENEAQRAKTSCAELAHELICAIENVR